MASSPKDPALGGMMPEVQSPRKRDYARERLIKKVRLMEEVRRALVIVVDLEIKDTDDKARLFHFRRGMDFVLVRLRELI